MKRKSELGEKIYHGGGVTGQRIGQRWIKYEYEDNGDYGFIYALYHTEDERF